MLSLIRKLSWLSVSEADTVKIDSVFQRRGRTEEIVGCCSPLSASVNSLRGPSTFFSASTRAEQTRQVPTRAEQTRLAPTRAEQTRLAPTRAEQTRLAPTRAEQTRQEQVPSRVEQGPLAETGT